MRKEKAAATFILIYAIALFVGVCFGALLGRSFGAMTIPVYAVMFVGPAIGIFRRKDWCRVLLGSFCAFVFAILIIIPLRADEFHVKPAYLGLLAITGFPVYLLFFWKPLKLYTSEEGQANQRVDPTPGTAHLSSESHSKH